VGTHRLWLWLVPIGILVLSAATLVLVGRSGSTQPSRLAALPASVALSPDLSARNAQPDLADYNVLIGMRDGLAHEARSLAATIGACERRVHEPYGAGLATLAACLSTPLRVAMMSARFAPVMMAGVLEHLGPGGCMQLASGLTTGFSELGDGSYAWIGDIQNPGPTSGVRNRGDASEMQQVASQILRLAASPSWTTACRPRPYDASEHPGTQRPKRTRPRGSRVTLTA
jgi:hypothetical protein